MPDLQRLYEEKKDVMDFLMIDVGEKEDIVNKFYEENKYKIPIGLDQNENITKFFRIEGFPTTIIIGSDKKIKRIVVGAKNEAILRKYIDKVLEQEG